MSFLAFKGRLLSLIVEEFQSYIPQFEPYTLDYQIVAYACRDLETWLKAKWNMDEPRIIYERLEEALDKEPKDFKVSLNFWVGLWLKKWRERVQVLSTNPKIPQNYMDRIKKARGLYREMNQRGELKKIVILKLMRQGEICMVEPIAENLIIEEIAKRIRSTDEESGLMIELWLNPLDILNNLSRRIVRLPKEKGPLIYLNIKPYML